MSTPLVGKLHKDTIEKLYEDFSRRTDKKSPQAPAITILEGVSGVGKSRIIRELYSKIRANREDTYWPALVSKPDTEYSPLSVRKQIGPPIQGFVWKAGALPTFGWWEFNGEKMSTGITMSMDKQVEDVVTVHTQPIAIATMKQAGFFRRMKKGPMQAVKDLRDLSRDELTDRLWELITETTDGIVPLPGLKLALKWTKGGISAARESRKEREALKQDVAQDEQLAEKRSETAMLLADTILGMARPDIPGMIVIEDMHLMDESFIAFLNEIIRQQNGALMVVGTAWPDSEIKGRSADNTRAYRNWRDQSAQRQDVQVLSIEAPSQAERVEIVRKWAPGISEDNARTLTERIQNPLALELVLTSNATKNALRRNNGDFPEGYIAKIPRALEEIYHDRLQELDEEVRRSIAAVAGALPDSDAQQTWPFIREHIARTLEQGRNKILVEDGFGGELSKTIRSLEIDEPSQTWLVPSGVADTFREALMAEVAAKHLDDDLGLLEDVRDEIHWQLGEWLMQKADDRFHLPSSDEVRIVSSWYLALDEGDASATSTQPYALLSAAYRLAIDHRTLHGAEHAAQTMSAALARVPDDMAGTYTSWTSDYLHWLESAHDDESAGLRAALEGANTLAQRAQQALEPTHPSHVDWLFRKGLLRKELNQVDEAISALEKAFEVLPNIAGHTELEPLEIQQHRVDLYESAGRIDESIELLAWLVNQARVTHALNAGYTHSMTQWLQELLARHERGVPEDYFDETDAQITARTQALDERAVSQWQQIQHAVRNGQLSEARSEMSRLYLHYKNNNLFQDLRNLDKWTETFAIELIDEGKASLATDFLLTWRSLRPASWSDWLIAWALEAAGETSQAIEVHQNGLEQWLRIPGANAADRGIILHRLGLAKLQDDIIGLNTLGKDIVAALAKESVVPEPDAAWNTQSTWLMESQALLQNDPRPWAEDWIHARGKFLVVISGILRDSEIMLSSEDDTRHRIWARIGAIAANEDPHEMREFHEFLRDDESFVREAHNEIQATKILAERLERLHEIRSARKPQN